MPSEANHTLNSYEVVAEFHIGTRAQTESRTVVALVNEESQEAARGLVASIADQLGAGDLFAATVTPIPMHSAAIEIDSATQYAVALASCINVQSICDDDELQSIASRIARTANAIAAQMGGAK